jgi:hypothetical protein
MIPVRIQAIGHLLKKQLLEQRRFYLLALLGLLVALVVFNGAFYYFVTEMNKSKYALFSLLVYNLGFIICTTLISAAAFYELHHPKNSIAYLQLPVTAPERIVANLFIAFVLMPLLMLGVIYCVDWLFTTVYNTRNVPRYRNPPLRPGLFFARDFSWVDFTLLTFLLNSIYFAGAVFFNKLHWVLTTVVAGLFITLLVTINVVPAFYGPVPLPFVLSLSNGILESGISQPNDQFTPQGYQLLKGLRVFLWAMPLLLLGAVYYRLKERQA